MNAARSPHFLLIGLIALLVAFPAPAAASHEFGVHWPRTKKEVTVKFGNNLTTRDWRRHFKVALGDWSASEFIKTRRVKGNAESPTVCLTTPGRVEVCNGDYGLGSGFVGLAIADAGPGGHIELAAVFLNDSFLNNPDFPTFNNPVARRHVLCHKIGHTLGLGHQHGGTGP